MMLSLYWNRCNIDFNGIDIRKPPACGSAGWQELQVVGLSQRLMPASTSARVKSSVVLAGDLRHDDTAARLLRGSAVDQLWRLNGQRSWSL